MTHIKEMVKQMSLEEKARLCTGLDFWHTQPLERLMIPSVTLSDGPHGLRKQEDKGDHLGINKSIVSVCFPTACATGCSFDRELMKELGMALGMACQAEHVAVLLGPGANIKRSPLCGRNFEYISEDPYLTGELAAAYINGVQSQNVGTSLKHFALNNQEFQRRICSSEVDERTLREIYLTGFEIAVKKAQPWTVMSSYNKINGIQASENKALLRDILKDTWGFQGFVVSDWGGVCDRVVGIAAGLDLEMPGTPGINDEDIIKSVECGKLDEALLDDSIERMLRVLFRYKQRRGEPDKEQEHLLAVKLAERTVVLLKNEAVLPLTRSQKIVFIGGFARYPRYQGGGSSSVNAYKVPSFLEAVLPYAKVEYAEGFSIGSEDEWDAEKINEAVRAAEKSEVVVVYAGLPESYESEAYDRKHMRLPEVQNHLIEELCKVNNKVVVVLQNGAPVELPWADQVQAVVEAYLGGEGIAEAVVKILFGEVNPSGKLAESFPLRLTDTPSYLSFPGINQKAVYSEGIFVGYRYYDTKAMEVRYPFGHGLSYTRFAYRELHVEQEEFSDTDSIQVSVEVENIGQFAGREVVQLYVKDTTNAARRPEKELKGFDVVYLEPGERKTVTMRLDKRSFAWYCEEIRDWYAASGEYVIAVGGSSRQIELEKTVKLHSTAMIPFNIDKNTTIGQLLKNDKTRDYTRTNILSHCQEFIGVLNDGHSAETVESLIENWTLYALRSFGGGTNEQITKYVRELRELL